MAKFYIIKCKKEGLDAAFQKRIPLPNGKFSYVKFNSKFPRPLLVENTAVSNEIRHNRLQEVTPLNATKAQITYLFQNHAQHMGPEWNGVLIEHGLKEEPVKVAKQVVAEAEVDAEPEVVETEVRPVRTSRTKVV